MNTAIIKTEFITLPITVIIISIGCPSFKVHYFHVTVWNLWDTALLFFSLLCLVLPEAFLVLLTFLQVQQPLSTSLNCNSTYYSITFLLQGSYKCSKHISQELDFQYSYNTQAQLTLYHLAISSEKPMISMLFSDKFLSLFCFSVFQHFLNICVWVFHVALANLQQKMVMHHLYPIVLLVTMSLIQFLV